MSRTSNSSNAAAILAGAAVAMSLTSLLLSFKTWRLRCQWQENEKKKLEKERERVMATLDASTKSEKQEASEIMTAAVDKSCVNNSTGNEFNSIQQHPRIRATLENQVLAENCGGLTVRPIGMVRSIYRLCVGTPRQGLLAPHARGRIELNMLEENAAMDSVIELERFSHIWILFVFHLNTLPSKNKNGVSAKIAPPALGGKKVGVLATRSPHRFNPIGMTLAQLDRVEIKPKLKRKQRSKSSSTFSNDSPIDNNNYCRVVLHISGLDLVDGTPVLDVKPFVPTYDSLDGTNGTLKLPDWVSEGLATRRVVTISETARQDLKRILSEEQNGDKRNPSSSSGSPLEFYGQKESAQKALENMLQCIQEVLAIDVRSSFQTQKARQGKYQAQRAKRLQTKTSSASSQTTSEEDIDNDDATSTDTCTQQLDNLLIHYTVTGASQMQRPTSEGSGAEDQVCVTSIVPMQWEQPSNTYS
jgi:tRNA (Thr-GGU) A37 N-methylase